jgi:hypothetical protein
MPDDLIVDRRTPGMRYIGVENMERAADAALEQRRARGEIMTYELDGWIVREFPGQRIVQLARVGQYRSEDFPVIL